MAKRKTVHKAVTNVPDEPEAMAETMLELANRGHMEESIVMRIAKAGGMTAVVRELSRFRVRAKKMGLVRAPRAPKPATAPRKRKPRGTQGADAGGASDTK